MLDFKLPAVGENIKSVNIVAILAAAGDVVKKDQPLLEMETDKASLEIPSPCDGTIKEILIKKGEDVGIGQVVMRIEEGKISGVAKTTPAASLTAAPESPRPAPESTSYAAQPQTATAVLPEIPMDVPAAPSVRRFAREIGINVAQVPGTGSGGRISIEDVKAFAKQLNTMRAGTGLKPVPALPDFAKWGAIDRQPMNNIRKKTAEHMTLCWTEIPHVTQFDKADITGLEQSRKRHSTPERKLTVTPFLLKVLAAALKAFPEFNASIDMATREIIYKKYCHIGVAVDTDRGLIVPVIRDVDRKTIYQLADELNTAAQRVRDKKISLDELQGGSITITNLGGIGGTQFTPIVNWPEVAILGVSRAQWEPCYTDGKMSHAPRFMLPLSLSYDHRLIDGASGARFLRRVCEALEQPFLTELEK